MAEKLCQLKKKNVSSGGTALLPDGEMYCIDWSNNSAQARHSNKTITARSGQFAVFGVINGKYSNLSISGNYAVWALIKKDGSIELKGKGSTASSGSALTSDDAYFLALGVVGTAYTFTLS